MKTAGHSLNLSPVIVLKELPILGLKPAPDQLSKPAIDRDECQSIACLLKAHITLKTALNKDLNLQQGGVAQQIRNKIENGRARSRSGHKDRALGTA